MDDAVEISVVSPFYNEAGIIDMAIRTMLEQLGTLDAEWELIVVGDEEPIVGDLEPIEVRPVETIIGILRPSPHGEDIIPFS